MDMETVAADAKQVVRDLGDIWAECKKLGVDILHVVDAVEAGDNPADVMAVLRAGASLPGGRPDVALRFARALRRQATPAPAAKPSIKG